MIKQIIELKVKEIKEFDKLLFQLIGPNSQDYLNWKDELNALSIDPDQ